MTRSNIASLRVSDHVVIPGTTEGYPMGGRFPIPPDRSYLELRQPEHERMFEILDLVATTIRPAVDAA